MNENRSSQIDYYQPLSTSTIVPTSITNNLNIPKLTTAQELLEDKFSIEILNNNKKKRIELTLGDKVCFVNHDSDLVCDTIVRGLLPKKSGGLESPTVYVLVADNKLDFYKIVEKAHKKYKMNLDIVLDRTMVKRIFTIYQLADFLITFDLAKDIKKYESKLFIITGDFFLNDSYIEKEEKDWLYHQMVEAVKKVTDSIILIFSPITLPNLQNISSK